MIVLFDAHVPTFRASHALAAAGAVALIAFVAFLPDTSLYTLDPAAEGRAWWLRILLGFSAAVIAFVVALASGLSASSPLSAVASSLAFVFGPTFTAQAALAESPLPLLSLVAILAAPAVYVAGRTSLPASITGPAAAYAPFVAGVGLAIATRLLFASETGARLRADTGLLGLVFVAAGSVYEIARRPVSGSLTFAGLAVLILVAAAGSPYVSGAPLAALAVMYVLAAIGMAWFLRAANGSRAAVAIIMILPIVNAVVAYRPSRAALGEAIASQAAGVRVVPQPLLADYLDRLPMGSIVVAGFGGGTAVQLAKVPASPFTHTSGTSWSSPPAPYHALIGVVGVAGLTRPFERNDTLAVDLRVDAGDPIGRTNVISPVPIRVLSDANGVLIDVGRQWMVRTNNGVGLVIVDPAGDTMAVHRLEPRAPFVVPPGTTEPQVDAGR